MKGLFDLANTSLNLSDATPVGYGAEPLGSFDALLGRSPQRYPALGRHGGFQSPFRRVEWSRSQQVKGPSTQPAAPASGSSPDSQKWGILESPGEPGLPGRDGRQSSLQAITIIKHTASVGSGGRR